MKITNAAKAARAVLVKDGSKVRRVVIPAGATTEAELVENAVVKGLIASGEIVVKRPASDQAKPVAPEPTKPVSQAPAKKAE